MLWVLLAVSAVLFLYPPVTTLLDVLEAIGNAPIISSAVLETRDRAIMQVLGFISLYVFLGVWLYYSKEPSQREVINNYENEVPEPRQLFSVRIDLEWSIAIGALTTLAVIALQYFSGIMDISEMVTGFVWPIAISIIAGLIVGLVAYLIIDKLNENEE